MERLRLSTDILLLVAIFIAPWWLLAFGALTAAVAFDFKELIIFAFLYDLLYAVPFPLFSFNVPFLLTCLACILYGILTLLKSYTFLHD